MNTPKKSLKCKYCSSPGVHQGWMYEMLPKHKREKLVRSAAAKSRGGAKRVTEGLLRGLFKRLDLPMCGQHYLQYMFNLLPYRCTAQCTRARHRSNHYPLKPKEYLMYFSQIAVAGGGRPKCGWCGKTLRPAAKEPEIRTLEVSIPDDDKEPTKLR